MKPSSTTPSDSKVAVTESELQRFAQLLDQFFSNISL